MQIRIGENLRKLRIKNELTQEKLAEVFGVSPQAISRWENNSTYPDVTMLPSIANYYNVSIISVICERIENSKHHKHSSVDKIIAIGPNTNSNDDLKRKIELLAQYLDVAFS